MALSLSRAKTIDWPSRIKPALIHLGSSALVGLFVATVVFGFWFPGAYRAFSGGTELFLLVFSVDLTLGPLITLVIFDQRKPVSELRRDVAIIVLLQLAALAYGLHMVSISRPVALALEVDRFRVVAASGVYEPELATAPAGMGNLSLTGPRLVRATMPTDEAEKQETLSLGLRGYDIGTRPSRWTPWDAAARAEALAHAHPLALLEQRYPARRGELDAAVGATGRPAGGLVYIPTITFRGDWVTLLDAKSGDVVGFAPFDGF